MSFSFRDATIAARELTIADENTISLLLNQLPEDTAYLSAYRWGEFVVGAQIEGDAPIPMVLLSSPGEDIRASYQAWQQQPRTLLQQWRAELSRVENPAPKKS